MARRRATVMSQARGSSGSPSALQPCRAATNASCTISSATAKSPPSTPMVVASTAARSRRKVSLIFPCSAPKLGTY
jgi:hypothetical protein